MEPHYNNRSTSKFSKSSRDIAMFMTKNLERLTLVLTAVKLLMFPKGTTVSSQGLVFISVGKFAHG